MNEHWAAQKNTRPFPIQSRPCFPQQWCIRSTPSIESDAPDCGDVCSSGRKRPAHDFCFARLALDSIRSIRSGTKGQARQRRAHPPNSSTPSTFLTESLLFHLAQDREAASSGRSNQEEARAAAPVVRGLSETQLPWAGSRVGRSKSPGRVATSPCPSFGAAAAGARPMGPRQRRQEQQLLLLLRRQRCRSSRPRRPPPCARHPSRPRRRRRRP